MDHPSADDAAAEDRFRQLFTDTYAALLAYSRRRCFDHADADDVVAEVYAVAWRRRHDIRDEPADRPSSSLSPESGSGSPSPSPLPWLYGIAANVIRNSRRSGSRRLQLVERLQTQPQVRYGEVGGPEADSAGAEMREALAQLSFDDQEVLRLVAWEGLSHTEAGEAMGCSANAIGIRVHRARQRLASELASPVGGGNDSATTATTDRIDPATPTGGRPSFPRSNDPAPRRGGATS